MDYVLINFTVLGKFYVISVLMVGGSAMKIRNWGIGICLSLFGTFLSGGMFWEFAAAGIADGYRV